MKRLFFYLSILLCAVLLGFILQSMKPDKVKKIITVDTEYSYLMGHDVLGSMMIYTNNLEHPLLKEENYMRILVKDHGSKSLIELSIYDVQKGHEEHYLKETFYRIIITFKVPELSQNWIFDDAYLICELKNQSEYELRLGRLSFYAPSHDLESLKWNSLEGRKQVGDLRSRLKTITLQIEGDCPSIEMISVGTTANTHFIYENGCLKIDIDHSPYLLYDVPIIIQFEDGSKQTISHFRFMTDYIILKESGPLINVYTFD